MKKILLVLLAMVFLGGCSSSKEPEYKGTYTPEQRKELEELNERQRQEKLQGKREMPDSHPEAKRSSGGKIRIGMSRTEIENRVGKGNWVLDKGSEIYVQYGGHRVDGYVLVYESGILTGTLRVTKNFDLEDHPAAYSPQ